MHTPATEAGTGLGATAKDVAEHAKLALQARARTGHARAQEEGLEPRARCGALALGAAVFGLYGLGFLFATIAAGLATACRPGSRS